jgi:hypothetical protein
MVRHGEARRMWIRRTGSHHRRSEAIEVFGAMERGGHGVRIVTVVIVLTRSDASQASRGSTVAPEYLVVTM